MIKTDSGLFTIFAFIVAFIMTFTATPVAQKIAFKVGAVDVPKDKRRMHTTPKARLGGIAIYFGFLVSVLCFGKIFTPTVSSRQLIGILTGATIVMVLGVFDDIKPRKAWVKFLIQTLAAIIPVMCGVRIGFLSNPFAIDPYVLLPKWISVVGTVFWIVAVTNAVNLIDGLDGLAAGISSIAAIALLSFLMIQHVTVVNILILAAALAGACFGFLPYNFNPSKLFMGDSGALFLGFILACISIQGPFKMYLAFSVPFLILGLPLFDTSFAIIRRIIKRQPIMAPDRGHLHHRLIDMGFSHRTTVVIMYGLSAILALSSIIMIVSGVKRALVLILSVLLFAFFAFTFLDKSNTNENDENNEKQEAQDDKEN